MLDRLPKTVEAIVAASKAGAKEAGSAIKRTLDIGVEASVGESGTLQSLSGQLDLDRPGLVIVLKMKGEAALITIASELLPDWCAAPDATGQSKLATLAQELGMNLYPDAWMPDDFLAHWVTNLSEALVRGGVLSEAAAIPIALMQGGKSAGSMGVIWPASRSDEIEQAKPAAPPAKPAAAQPKALTTPPYSAGGAPGTRRVINAKDLPSYTKTLLRISVPVVVTLARKRQALSRILEMSPGSIIQFDKPCEEMLDLMIGNRPVAVGEAVKVGDKFGLRVTSIASPEERFHPASPKELMP